MERYYLDNAATTRMLPEAMSYAQRFLRDEFYNPSAVYDQAVAARREIDKAREGLKELLGACDGRLIFTGSATEANNMVIFSNRNFKNKTFLFGAGEHPSVMECSKELAARGADVKYIPLDASGRVSEEALKKLLGPEVAFISIQHVSNETGAINDIRSLVRLAKRANKDVLFHSDGVQAFMKLDYSVDDLGVDYYTISAHKIGGGKGIGALWVKKGVKINPLIHGGGQEEGLRSGTENLFNIASFIAAAKKMSEDFERNREHLASMRKSLLEGFEKQGLRVKIHGGGVDNIMSVAFQSGVRGETLLHALEKRGIYVSTGSACSSSKHFNSTLEGMGIDKDEILESIRISLSPYEDFDGEKIAAIIKEELEHLKGKSYGKMSAD